MTNLVIKFLTVKNNPAESFARWMSKRRAELDITLDVLQERTGIKKQHLSVLERAAPHPLTGKAVIPKRPTVEKIAKGLEMPTHLALEAAGYVSVSESSLEDAERVELEAMYRKRRNLSPARKEAFRRILDMVDRELDLLYEEEQKETQTKTK